MFMRWFGTRKRVLEQSPAWRFTASDMSSGEALTQELSRAPYGKYSPYNYIQITNQTDKDLTLILNGSWRKTIPSGTIMSIDSDTVPAFRSFAIVNESGATATGEVEVIIQKIKNLKDIARSVGI